MPASPKPSPSGSSRRGLVRSGVAIAHRLKNYERSLVKRIRIAGGIALLQALLGAVFTFIARRLGSDPWIVGTAAALSFAAGVGIFFKFRIAGIVAVALTVLNIALLIRSNNWTALLLPVIFLLLYVDGMRALSAWSRMRAVAPAAKLDIEALQ
jgi:hypothetical protein